jgi:hypothetical protein
MIFFFIENYVIYYKIYLMIYVLNGTGCILIKISMRRVQIRNVMVDRMMTHPEKQKR